MSPFLFTMLKLLIPLLLSSSHSFAQDTDFKFDAFASITYIDGDVENEIDDLDFSAVGFQIEKAYSDFRFVVQVHAVGITDWQPELNWAFVEYEYAEGSYITVGRFISSFYEYSQSSYIGHSYIWTKLPMSVYGIDFNSIDGLNLKQEFNVGDNYITFDLSVGQRNADYIVAGVEHAGGIENYLGFTTRIESDHWTYRFNYTQAKATHDSDLNYALRDTPFKQNVSYNPSQIDSLIFVDDKLQSVAAYIKYSNDWLIEAEIQRFIVNDAYLASDTGYYISIGYQFDKIIPYFLLTGSTTDLKYTVSEFNKMDPRLPVQGLYSTFHDLAVVDYISYSIGARYDFNHHTSLSIQAGKADFNHDIGKDDTIFSLSLNFLF